MNVTARKMACLLLAIALLALPAAGCDGQKAGPMEVVVGDSPTPGGQQDIDGETGGEQGGNGDRVPGGSPAIQGATVFNIRTKEQVSADSSGSEWPSWLLPDWFPVYPDAEIVISAAEDDGYYIQVTGTGLQAFKAYVDKIKSAGWELEDEYTDEDVAVGWRGDLFVVLVFADTDVGIFVGMYAEETYDWPGASLPADFPAYAGGGVVSITNGDDTVYIRIAKTTMEDYNAYIAALKVAGWDFDRYADASGDPYEDGLSAGKDTYILTIVYEDPGYVNLLVAAFDFDIGGPTGSKESKDWPDDLPFDLPMYPDGELLSVVSASPPGNIYISIGKTSRVAYEEYIDLLVKQGWEADDDKYASPAIMQWYGGAGEYDILLTLSDDGTSLDIFIPM